MLGGSTLVGVVYIESKNGQITNLFKKLGSSLSSLGTKNTDSSTQETGQGAENFSQSVDQVFVSVGTWIVDIFKSIWNQVTKFYNGIADLLKDNQSKGKALLKGLKNFFLGWTKWEIFSKIFHNLHLKFVNIILFMFDSTKNKEFRELLGYGEGKSNQWNQFFDTVKLLLGLSLTNEEKENKFLKVDFKVFHFLLLAFLDDPERITKKIKRLSEKVSGIKGKIGQQTNFESGQQTDATANGKKKKDYRLTISEIEKWLTVEGELFEWLYDEAWIWEMSGNSKLGIAKSLISIGSKWFNRLLPKPKKQNKNK